VGKPNASAGDAQFPGQMFDQRLLAPVNDDLLVTADQACERTLLARVGKHTS
jgi:hypothetical protein